MGESERKPQGLLPLDLSRRKGSSQERLKSRVQFGQSETANCVQDRRAQEGRPGKATEKRWVQGSAVRSPAIRSGSG